MNLKFLAAVLIVAVGCCPMTLQSDVTSHQQQLDNFRSNGNYDEAIKLLTALTKDKTLKGQKKKEILIVRYYNLGVLQFESTDFAAAKKSFEKSRSIAAKLEGRYSESLADTLGYLGIVLLKLDEPKLALDRLQQAQHIIHRANGVKSIEQEYLIDWLTMAQLKLDKGKKADTLQRFKYDIFTSTYGKSHPKTVPALLGLAKWFKVSAQYAKAEQSYQLAREISEQHSLKTEMLETALSGLAHIYYLKGKCCADEYMTKAAEAISRDESYDNLEKSRAFVRAADMSLIQKKLDESEALYEEAWNYGGALSEANYEKPTLLGISRIDRMIRAYRPDNTIRVNSYNFGSKNSKRKGAIVGAPMPFCAAELKDLAKNRDFSKYVIDLNFKVTPEGRATNVRVVNSNAPSAISQLVGRIVRLYRFRPRLSHGKPVVEEMQLRQTFGHDSRVSTDQFAPAQLAAIHGCKLLAST